VSELRVLEEARSRRATRAALARRRRRRHRALIVAGTIALACVALLVVMAASASGPSTPTAHAIARKPQPTAPAPPKPKPYGTVPSPHQVTVRLKLPLTSGLLFDVRTGHVLWQRRPNDVLPIASLTKMMTALVVVMHAREQDRVLITPQAVHFTGSGVGLLPRGKRVRMLPLLYGLLLPSGNDAAIALAQHVAGTQPRFIATRAIIRVRPTSQRSRTRS
jgi:serine-type D-Ala-D-Ala carboxypeptidase (penicillin-binding protein 5/6)